MANKKVANKVGDTFGDSIKKYCWILISKEEAIKNFIKKNKNYSYSPSLYEIEACKQNEKEFLCCFFVNKKIDYSSTHITHSHTLWNYL